MPVTLPRVTTTLLEWKRVLRPRSRLLAAIDLAKRENFGVITLDDLIVDLRYGGWCGGLDSTPTEKDDAVRVQSTHYRTLRKLFSHPLARVQQSDVLVDVGCGKGRVINHWLAGGHRGQIYGVELRAEIADWTRARLRHTPNVQIITGDATQVTPTDGTLYYLYNPFGARTLAAFADRVRSATPHPEKLRIVYVNPAHIHVFEQSGWKVTSVIPGPGDAGVIVTCD